MITKEMVFSAADALKASEQKPTLEAVRAALGAGSYSTISKWVAEWRTIDVAAQATDPEPLPSAITSQLTALADEIWSAARAHAKARLEVERAAIKQECTQYEERLKEALATADLHNKENDDLRSHIAVLNEEATYHQKSVREVLESIKEVKAELHDGSIRETELRETIATLQVQLKHMHEQNGELIRLVGKRKEPVTENSPETGT